MWIPNDLDLLNYGEDLSPAGEWSVYSRYERVVNFRSKDRLISVCASSIPSGVGNLRLNCSQMDWLESLQIQAEIVILNGAVLPLGKDRLWRVPQLKLPQSHPDYASLSEILAELAPPLSLPGLLLSKTPAGSFRQELLRQIRQGLQLLAAEDYRKAAGFLKGRGYGSTPSGTDLLIGYLLALAWLEQRQKNKLSEIADLILVEMLGSDALSNAFARRARALKPDSDWAELLLELANPKPDVRPAFVTVISHGATSGADALMGFLTALRQHSPRRIYDS